MPIVLCSIAYPNASQPNQSHPNSSQPNTSQANPNQPNPYNSKLVKKMSEFGSIYTHQVTRFAALKKNNGILAKLIFTSPTLILLYPKSIFICKGVSGLPSRHGDNE